MLICSKCGKVIANTNPIVIYGVCASCPTPTKTDKKQDVYDNTGTYRGRKAKQ